MNTDPINRPQAEKVVAPPTNVIAKAYRIVADDPDYPRAAGHLKALHDRARELEEAAIGKAAAEQNTEARTVGQDQEATRRWVHTMRRIYPNDHLMRERLNRIEAELDRIEKDQYTARERDRELNTNILIGREIDYALKQTAYATDDDRIELLGRTAREAVEANR